MKVKGNRRIVNSRGIVRNNSVVAPATRYVVLRRLGFDTEKSKSVQDVRLAMADIVGDDRFWDDVTDLVNTAQKLKFDIGF